MASMALTTRPAGAGKVFVKSQFCTKCVPPPKGTSLVGKTAVITGSNVGIGLEACREILSLGLSHLIMAVRTVSKGEAVASSLRTAYPQAKIEVWPLDMLSYDSVQAFARRCETLPRLDVVILSAGVFSTEFKITTTGYEEAFQVNYLSTALLALLLLPVLKTKRSADPGHLTLVSSSSCLAAEFPNRNAVPLLPSFNDAKFYGSFFDRYSTSKVLVTMLTHKLSQHVKADDVIVNTVDPGYVTGTSLHRTFSGGMAFAFDALKRLSARTLKQGAWTYLDAAVVKGKESHGGFVVDFGIYPFHAMMYTPEGKSTMERLWEETLKELDFARVGDVIDSM